MLHARMPTACMCMLHAFKICTTICTCVSFLETWDAYCIASRRFSQATDNHVYTLSFFFAGLVNHRAGSGPRPRESWAGWIFSYSTTLLDTLTTC